MFRFTILFHHIRSWWRFRKIQISFGTLLIVWVELFKETTIWIMLVMFVPRIIMILPALNNKLTKVTFCFIIISWGINITMSFVVSYIRDGQIITQKQSSPTAILKIYLCNRSLLLQGVWVYVVLKVASIVFQMYLFWLHLYLQT